VNFALDRLMLVKQSIVYLQQCGVETEWVGSGKVVSTGVYGNSRVTRLVALETSYLFICN